MLKHTMISEYVNLEVMISTSPLTISGFVTGNKINLCCLFLGNRTKNVPKNWSYFRLISSICFKIFKYIFLEIMISKSPLSILSFMKENKSILFWRDRYESDRVGFKTWVFIFDFIHCSIICDVDTRYNLKEAKALKLGFMLLIDYWK